MRRLSASLVCLAFGLSAPAEAADLSLFSDDTFTPTVADSSPHWGAWAALGGAYGTEESSFGEITIFVPFMRAPDSLFFTELNATYFEGDLIEGNAALGYRRMTGSGFNLGVWAGLDILYTDSDNAFGQVSGGFEALSEYFDLRVNGYLPFTDGQTAGDGKAEAFLSDDGTSIYMIGGEEVALYGIDGEIGGRLPLAPDNAAFLGVYGGGFWFDHDDAYEEIAGGKARLELTVNDIVKPGSQITAQYAYTHDNVRGDRHFIGGALRIPLGATTAARDQTGQEWRMLEGLERERVVIGQSDRELVADALTDVDFDQVTMASDATSLGTAVGAGGNNLIIVDGVGGQIDLSSTDGQALQMNQTLQGGGSTILVRGRNSGAVTGFTAPGSTPTLFSADSNAGTGVITVASNTHIAGVDILGSGTEDSGNHGIRTVDGLSNIVIEQTNITDPGGDGIKFGANNDNVRIAEVTITNPGNEGMDLGASNTNIVIEDTTITGGALTMTDGIEFSSNNTATIRNVRITDATIEAIEFAGGGGSTATISDVVIINGGQNGLDVDGANTITMNNTRFSGTFGSDVIQINDAGNTLDGSGNVFDGTSTGGFFCNAAAGQIGQFTFSSPVTTCP